MVWREIKIRYKQTALGLAWAVVQPLFTMIVFSIFFGRLAKMPSDGLPYPIFALCALLPWQLFAYSLTEASNSVVSNQKLITKVYFPRLIMPLSALGVGLVDFCVAFLLLLSMAAYYGVTPSMRLADRAALGPARGPHGAVGGSLAVGDQRQLPRRALHACRS